MNRTALSLLIGLTVALLAFGGMAWYVLYGKEVPQEEPLTDRSGVWFSDSRRTLLIPKLGIETRVESVGRTPEGNMANPSTFHTVAWFKEGAAPGGIGSAVIAGHVDNALSLAGVFKDLHTLTPGDEVLLNVGTSTLRYRVLRLEEYPYDAAPLAEIFGREDGRYLNLVTCAGTWLSDRQTYDTRLVVYTELVD